MPQETETKYYNALKTLRCGIIDGTYGLPGKRMPPQSVMCEMLGVGASTIQRAYNTLADDGFLQVRSGRSGTYVAENPPHLCNYGWVIDADEAWSRFFVSMREALKSVRTKRKIRFHEYLTSREVGSRADVPQLYRDIRHRRLAGLIFTSDSAKHDTDDIRGVDQHSLPKVAIHEGGELGLPTVYGDRDSFIDRAIEYLFSKGRRRIAHLCIDYPLTRLEEFETGLRRRGVDTRPYWVQPIPIGSVFRGASRVVNVLMQLEGDRRPDALIIHDDNLIEHATAGLMVAGIKVPEEVEVVAQSNFPAPVTTVLPIVHLGYDCRRFISECLRVLDIQSRGQTPPAATGIPAIFETELSEEFSLDAGAGR